MNRDKFIIIPLLILSVFVIYNSSYENDNGRANIWTNDEREFFKPLDIVWRGEIISTMTGGSCIGMKGEFGNYRWALACLQDMDSDELWKFQGEITVTGKWIGITCAYKNTIFGKCVPNVSIENIF